MDMLKMIQRMTDIENEEKRKNLTESALGECGEAGMMPQAENPGNPVTMSVTLNASGKDHVSDLMDMLKAAGLEKAGPVGPSMMPMRQDMDRLGDIMRNSSMGEEDLEEYDNEPEETYMDQPKGGGINRRKDMYSNAEDGDNAMAVESDDDDRDELTKKLFPKKSRADMEKSDRERNRKMNQKNFMKPGKPRRSREWGAYESTDEMRESIKSALLRSLEEKKSKPDFLDVDKDGNKKEPMKKAFKDKGGKSKKGKVPPQFQKKK